MSDMLRRGLFLVLATTIWACGGGVDDEIDPQQALENDIAQYESLQKELETTREEFVKTPAQDFYAAGNTLYWVEVGSGNPLLRSFDDGAKKRTDYTFKVFLTGTSAPNPVDTINYHASSSTIATMNVLDGGNVYAAGFPEQLLGKLSLPAPSFGQRWWAYSVSGEDVFVVVIDSTSGKYMLQKWSVSQSAFTTLLALDDLITPNVVGEFLDFAVDGTTLIFAESGRIWMADLADSKAKWVKNDKEIGSANFYDGGVVYSQGAEFYRYDMATDTRENLTEKIEAGYTMNKTFFQAHYPDNNGSWSKHKNKIVYHGSSGIFAYDMTSEKVIPLLLDARDNSVVYRNPTPVDTGTLFVKGLVSQSGATGADGPTY
ncbi:MAG TPA: hypothetical protein PK156_50190, partial [Polyangium sp.]|nr:hypothetical protein [Polyangium sp.]